jgi:hypothetical protein
MLYIHITGQIPSPSHHSWVCATDSDLLSPNPILSAYTSSKRLRASPAPGLERSKDMVEVGWSPRKSIAGLLIAVVIHAVNLVLHPLAQVRSVNTIIRVVIRHITALVIPLTAG